MNGMHNNHHHVFRYLLNKKELNELYISVVLRTLAFSMIGIFVPLFLFKELGYSLSYVIYYFLIYSFSFMVFTPVGAKLVDKIGFKHVMLTSMPLYVFYFILLYFLEINSNLFVFVPLVNGIAEGLYWISFHLDFSTFSQKKMRGMQIGRWYTFAILAGLIGPMTGGFVLSFSGFNLLFIIVSLLLIGSTVPLFYTKDIKKKYNYSFDFLKVGSFRDLGAFICAGAKGMVGMVFWPIFIFAILKMYVTMGSLFTLLGIFSLLITLVMGKLTDVFNKRKLIKVFSVSHSIVWIVTIFIKTKLELVGISIFSTLTAIGGDIPFTALTYNKAKKNINYWIFREFGLSVGRIIVLFLVLITGNLLSSFVYAAIASLGYILL